MTTAFSYPPLHPRHVQPGHVERPERLDAMLALLRDDAVWKRLHHVDPLPADLDAARLVHTDAYLQQLVDTVEAGGAQLDPDTYATPESLEVALQTVGSLLAVTRAVLEGAAVHGFAAGRPPGHHATPDRPMGFCLLSNVALAARWARRHYGLERILIVDFDVHHGNGTQEVFYEDPHTLFMSLHQDPLWPGTGAVTERGSGAGEGTTVNIPLPPHTGDDGYLMAAWKVLAPLARAFRPEVIFLSAGYDAHWQDPLGRMNLSCTGFGRLVLELMEWADACCDNRLVAVLEGGYHAEALAHSLLTTLRRLDDPGAEPSDPLGPAPRDDADVRDYLSELHGYFGAG